MTTRKRSGLKVTLASGTVAEIMPLYDRATRRHAVQRAAAPALNPIVNTSSSLDYNSFTPQQGITANHDDFSQGCGAYLHEPGRYSLADDMDTRWPGMIMPGPLQVADLTGIASGEKVIKRILHNGVNWLISSTSAYRENAGVWQERGATGAGWVAGNPTDIVSFNSSGGIGVVAIAMGAATTFQYSVDNGANWVASTKAGNAKYANSFCVAQAESTAQLVWYVRNPNDLFSCSDLTNAGASSVSSTVGDFINDEFTSIIEAAGALYMGKRTKLYTINSIGLVRTVAGPYRYIASSDAGTGAGLANFKEPVVCEGLLYYPVEDYRIIEIDPSTGAITEDMQPAWFGPQVPRMQHPLLAMCNVNGWLCVGLGTSDTAKVKSVAFAPGGASSGLIANAVSVNKSDFYLGRYHTQPDGSRQWRWHGVLFNLAPGDFASGNVPRTIWYDSTTSYLYAASAGAESANAQQRRWFIPATNPLYAKTSGSIVLAPSGTLQTALAYYNQPDMTKTLRRLKARTVFTTTTTDGSVGVRYRTAADDEAVTFTSLATLTAQSGGAAAWRTGRAFPDSTTFQGVRYQITVSGNIAGTLHNALMSFQAIYLVFSPAKDIITFTFKAVNGKVLTTGARSTQSFGSLHAFLVAWQDATDPAVIMDNETGETWSARLESFTEDGLGRDRLVQVVAHEVAS